METIAYSLVDLYTISMLLLLLLYFLCFVFLSFKVFYYYYYYVKDDYHSLLYIYIFRTSRDRETDTSPARLNFVEQTSGYLFHSPESDWMTRTEHTWQTEIQSIYLSVYRYINTLHGDMEHQVFLACFEVCILLYTDI